MEATDAMGYTNVVQDAVHLINCGNSVFCANASVQKAKTVCALPAVASNFRPSWKKWAAASECAPAAAGYIIADSIKWQVDHALDPGRSVTARVLEVGIDVMSEIQSEAGAISTTGGAIHATGALPESHLVINTVRVRRCHHRVIEKSASDVCHCVQEGGAARGWSARRPLRSPRQLAAG